MAGSFPVCCSVRRYDAPPKQVVVKKNLDGLEICAVAAVVEYREAAESLQRSLVKGSGFLFPSFLESGEKRGLALMPPQMTTNLRAH